MSRGPLFSRVGRAASLAIALATGWAPAGARTLTLATTEDLAQSGLLTALLPAVRQASGMDVQVQARSAADAIAAGRSGDADVVLLSDRAAEDKLVAEGHALKRIPLMANEYVLVGPKSDPAAIAGKPVLDALKKIDATRALFISRGDGSTANLAEQALWLQAGQPKRRGGSYRECRCATGGVLDIAATSYGYALADRGTWQAFRNRAELVPLVEGDARLQVVYGMLAVNHERRAKGAASARRAAAAQRARDAQKLVQWLASPSTQAAIVAFKVHGQPFFYPPPK